MSKGKDLMEWGAVIVLGTIHAGIWYAIGYAARGLK